MVEVFVIVVHDVNGLTADSHRVIDPVYPVSVNSLLVLPVQIVVPPVTDPPTLA